jgi:hypothetical protein
MGGEGMQAGMQEGIGSMMGQAMMQPQAQEQEQVPQKDYAKIKQILKQLYASNPQKFREFLMKIKDKLPPEVLQELVMAIQEESEPTEINTGIMSVPIENNRVQALGGLGGIVSGVGKAVGSVASGIGKAVGSVAGAVGNIAGSIDLGDVATAAAFYFGGPQAAAFVNSATGGTGNKFLDMGLNLYAGGVGQGGGGFDVGSAFSSGFDDFGTGGVFPQSGGGFFDDFGTGGIFPQSGGGSGGVSSGVFDDFGTGGVFPQSGGGSSGGFDLSKILSGGAKVLGEQLGKLTGKDYVDLAKLGGSAYAAKLARDDQERINKIVEEENRRFRAAQEAKRSQYSGPSALGIPRQTTTADVVRAPVARGGIMEVDREKYGFGSMFTNLINKMPGLIKEVSSINSGQNNDSFVGMQFGDFIDRDKDGIDDRKQGRSFLTAADVVRRPAAMGGRMRYAMGNSVQDGIMAAPQIAMQMGMPVGNPRRNQQGITELDYRNEGGFVPPIGIKEKADDIPAMLSNNEFVFTADAVGGADPEGKQDRERGAKVMYTLMKRLENGGIV